MQKRFGADTALIYLYGINIIIGMSRISDFSEACVPRKRLRKMGALFIFISNLSGIKIFYCLFILLFVLILVITECVTEYLEFLQQETH